MTERILFTSEEEAEKAWYVLLSSNWYDKDTYEEKSNTIVTQDYEVILADDSRVCYDWEVVHEDDWDNFFYCDHCDNYFYGSHYYWVEARGWYDETWCENCRDEHSIYDAYTWNTMSNERFEQLDGWYDERRDECTTRERDDYEDCLDWYHNWTSKDMSEWSHLRFGMELEKNEICWDSEAHSSYKKAWWRCEEDWSVEAEYITPILWLDDIDKSIEWIMSTGRDIVDGDINDSCWGHIHISTKNINESNTELFYRKVRLFMPLLWAIYPERATNSYCGKNTRQLSSTYSQKYSDCTPHSYYWSVEIRIFPWVASEKTMRFRLGLCKIIAKKAEELMDKDCDYRTIIEYIKGSTELMEVLSIVYNTPEKINTLVERIIPAYNEAIESNSENYKLTKASAFAKKLEAFVVDKNLPSVDE